MTNKYSVLELKATDSNTFQRLAAEQLGSKRKFWFSFQDQTQPWLFKFARKNSGEHWSEKIAGEVAPLIHLPAAHVELARFNGELGIACESFIPYVSDATTRQPIKLGELVHGNEVLAGWVTGYDKTKTFGQADHTWGNIHKAIVARFPDRADHYLQQLAGLLVFDALICNVDRHHENWAILLVRESDPQASHLNISPSYDHASSLGRELTDSRRAAMLQQRRMSQYVKNGRGGIYWDGSTKHAPGPMELLRHVAEENPNIVKPWLDNIRQLTEDKLMEPIARIPDSCMTDVQRDFCRGLLQTTMGELRSLAE